MWSLYGLEPHSREPSYDSWYETIHPDDRTETDRLVKKAVAKCSEFATEWRAPDGKGGWRCLMAREEPVYDAGVKPIRFLGIVVDITERKRSEEAFRESKNTFRTLFHSLKDLINMHAGTPQGPPNLCGYANSWRSQKALSCIKLSTLSAGQKARRNPRRN
ncbi:MAG: PAS domain-containing protein [Desulfomonilaceae bacterium]